MSLKLPRCVRRVAGGLFLRDDLMKLRVAVLDGAPHRRIGNTASRRQSNT